MISLEEEIRKKRQRFKDVLSVSKFLKNFFLTICFFFFLFFLVVIEIHRPAELKMDMTEAYPLLYGIHTIQVSFFQAVLTTK